MDFAGLPILGLSSSSASPEESEQFEKGIARFAAFETKRLRVRPITLDANGADSEDVKSLHKVLGPPEVHGWNYLFKNGFSLGDAFQWISARVKGQAQGTAIALLTEDKNNREILGEVHADFDPSRLVADVGYATVYGPTTQGKGYATEATHAFLEALCELGLRHIVLTAAPDNSPSHKVIEKLGVPQIDGVTINVVDQDGQTHARNLYYCSAVNWRNRMRRYTR